MTNIKLVKREVGIGDKVRSFDFAMTTSEGERLGRDLSGQHAHYVEGVVTDLEDLDIQGRSFDCLRYAVRVERRVVAGVERKSFSPVVYPPVNGTPSWIGGMTDFVELIDE